MQGRGMIEVSISMSNEAARATRAEVRRFLLLLAEKVSGDKKDKSDTATLAYVVLQEIKVKLDNHITRLDRENERNKPVRPAAPTVRQQREFR